jgi:hypothetical protein
VGWSHNIAYPKLRNIMTLGLTVEPNPSN